MKRFRDVNSGPCRCFRRGPLHYRPRVVHPSAIVATIWRTIAVTNVKNGKGTVLEHNRGRIVRPRVDCNILELVWARDLGSDTVLNPGVGGPLLQRAAIGHDRNKNVVHAVIKNGVPAP